MTNLSEHQIKELKKDVMRIPILRDFYKIDLEKPNEINLADIFLQMFKLGIVCNECNNDGWKLHAEGARLLFDELSEFTLLTLTHVVAKTGMVEAEVKADFDGPVNAS
jgi:hypothetical protein